MAHGRAAHRSLAVGLGGTGNQLCATNTNVVRVLEPAAEESVVAYGRQSKSPDV